MSGLVGNMFLPEKVLDPLHELLPHRWWNPTFCLSLRMKAMITGTSGMDVIRYGRPPAVRERQLEQCLGFAEQSANEGRAI